MFTHIFILFINLKEFVAVGVLFCSCDRSQVITAVLIMKIGLKRFLDGNKFSYQTTGP